MQRSVLLLHAVLLSATFCKAQRTPSLQRGGGATTGNSYCVPDFITGPADGDWVDGVQLGTILTTATGDSLGLEHNDYFFAGTGSTTRLVPGASYDISITSGAYAEDYLLAWIDFDRNNVFAADELIGQGQTQVPFETLVFNFTVPFDALPGYTGLRVMCTFSLPSTPDPCAIGYNWGETEDYAVLLDNNGPCIPLTVYGTTDGDFLSQVSLAGMSDASGFAGKLPYSLPTRAAHLDAGMNYSLNLVTGDYSDDRVAVWVDWNKNGTFEDPSEYVGGFLATSSFFQGQVPINVPADAWGWIPMRVIIADETTITPCGDIGFGESRDYMLVINHPLLPCLTYNFGGAPTNYGINSVDIAGNGVGPFSGFPNHYITGTYPPLSVQPGQSMPITVGGGDLPIGRYQVWFDANADLDYDDAGESVGSQSSTTPGQLLSFPFTLPANLSPGGHYVRIAAFGPQVPTQLPCTDPTAGQVYDIMVTVDPQGGVCIPALSDWTLYGDYVDGVQIGDIDNTSSGALFGPPYTDFTALSTDLVLGYIDTVFITAGEYDDDVFGAWIDYNGDGDWSDPDEFLGSAANTQSFQVMPIIFTVPLGLPLGSRTMRIRCQYNTQPDPCANGDYGETEDYTVVLNSSTGVGEEVATDMQVIVAEHIVYVSVPSALVGASYALLDATGRQVRAGAFSDARTAMDMTNCTAGAYVLLTNTVQGPVTERFVLR